MEAMALRECKSGSCRAVFPATTVTPEKRVIHNGPACVKCGGATDSKLYAQPKGSNPITWQMS